MMLMLMWYASLVLVYRKVRVADRGIQVVLCARRLVWMAPRGIAALQEAQAIAGILRLLLPVHRLGGFGLGVCLDRGLVDGWELDSLELAPWIGVFFLRVRQLAISAGSAIIGGLRELLLHQQDVVGPLLFQILLQVLYQLPLFLQAPLAGLLRLGARLAPADVREDQGSLLKLSPDILLLLDVLPLDLVNDLQLVAYLQVALLDLQLLPRLRAFAHDHIDLHLQFLLPRPLLGAIFIFVSFVILASNFN